MNLGIIGIGIVGNANLKGFRHLGHTVKIHDIKLNTTINNIINTEIVFICVPTPSNQYKECDTSIISNIIDELNILNYKGIIAIRSTVTPGFTQNIIENYKNLTICFIPEFLRERHAVDDFINNHKLLVIGTYDIWVFKKVVQAHGNLPKHIEHLTPTEAEILKYFNNVYASLRVTFANIMYEVCDKLNCDYTTVKNTYIKTDKAIDMYLDVNPDLRGYGGMCLPKDTKALVHLLDKLNLNYDLVKAIDIDNSKFKKTVFKGMRE